MEKKLGNKMGWVQYCIAGDFGGSQFWRIWQFFHLSQKLNPPFSSTVHMLNDMCLLICQIKIRQSQKMSNSPNFNPLKYTRYTVIVNYCDKIMSKYNNFMPILQHCFFQLFSFAFIHNTGFCCFIGMKLLYFLIILSL